MWQDPIVEELHQVRRHLQAEHGDDLERLVAYLMDYQSTSPSTQRELASLVPRPAVDSSNPSVAKG